MLTVGAEPVLNETLRVGQTISVSESNVESTVRYIKDQEKHHRKVSFQEEFVTFLKKRQIAYAPRGLLFQSQRSCFAM